MRTRAAAPTAALSAPHGTALPTALPTACGDRSSPAPTHAPRKATCPSLHRCVRGPAPHRAQWEVLDLLSLAPASALVRLSRSDWRRVDNVADALAQARTRPALIPRPRAGAGGQDGVTADIRDLVGKVAGANVSAAR